MANSFKIALVFCFLFCFSLNGFSATYTVTKTTDTNDGTCDSDCSLREAVTAAGATAENDLIVFSGTVFNTAQTITLSIADIVVNSGGALIITGPGANLLTVNGNNASRVFTNNTSAVTTISNLRITGGNGVSTTQTGRGGGVYNNGGNLTLMNVIVSGNSAANGGGLNNAGTATLTLINCTISGNTATGAGGGMQNFSGNTMNILNTTVSGNTSNSNLTGGGGIQANGTLNIANSTFSGNTASSGGDGGAMYYNGSGLTMNNVTIANNTATSDTGGIYKSTTTNNANFRNTLIAGNIGGASPDAFGAFNSLGNNLIGVVGTSSGWIASDLQNQNAMLAPLANNGGPTQTHALQFGSPALNAGQNCVVDASCTTGNPFQPLTTDQRGTNFPRAVSGAVDIGAFELNIVCFCLGRRVFDFDGDGKSDFAVFRPSNSTWYIQRSTSGFYAAQFGISSDVLTPEDYDGDGKTDIAVWRSNVSNNRSYFYILQSSTNTLRAEQFGATGDDPRVVGDWDGDGKADLAVYRSLVGTPENPPQSFFYYRPSATAGVDFRTIQWGFSGDKPVAKDYDGDGKMDAAVFRSSNQIWYILQSSNNQARYQNWGLSGDKLVPADYDGDGKADVAVFRNGLWAILQSSNNQQRYQNWGDATDKLVPADYDGDNKIDFAVWRNNTFFVLGSSSNQSIVYQFGTSNDIPVASAMIQ